MKTVLPPSPPLLSHTFPSYPPPFLTHVPSLPYTYYPPMWTLSSLILLSNLALSFSPLSLSLLSLYLSLYKKSKIYDWLFSSFLYICLSSSKPFSIFLFFLSLCPSLFLSLSPSLPLSYTICFKPKSPIKTIISLLFPFSVSLFKYTLSLYIPSFLLSLSPSSLFLALSFSLNVTNLFIFTYFIFTVIHPLSMPFSFKHTLPCLFVFSFAHTSSVYFSLSLSLSLSHTLTYNKSFFLYLFLFHTLYIPLSLSLSLALSLSLFHSINIFLSFTHTQCVFIFPLSLSPSISPPLTLSNSHTRSSICPFHCSLSPSHTYTHILTHTHTHNTYTHTRTSLSFSHTHTVPRARHFNMTTKSWIVKSMKVCVMSAPWLST